MKKIFYSAALLAALSFSSCSDQFLEDKQNFDNVTEEVYNNYAGASGRVLDLYWWILPDGNSDANWKNPCTGNADGISKSTEEYAGFGTFVDPQTPLTADATGDFRVPDYFHNQSNNIRASVWGRIRNCNDVIWGLNQSTLPEDQKNELLGQAYFLRAWCYYNIIKWYGGVPLVTEVLPPLASSFTPRSTTRESFQFIFDDLDTAAELLRAKTIDGGWSGDNYGRVTTASAMALKGRAMVLWASPLFNRANDEQRWKDAYEYIKGSIDDINACGNNLYQTGNNINGSDFAKMFATSGVNPEMVFGVLHNTLKDDDTQKNNRWERNIRPKNTTGQGVEASATFVDMFPMKDGKRPRGLNTYTKLEESSDYSNIKDYPFLNRDPRFYRTFAMPGFRWAYSGDATQADSYNPNYNSGKDYVLWNYIWYTEALSEGGLEVERSGRMGGDNLLNSVRGVYVRKRSNDGDISTPLYDFDPLDSDGGFVYSAAPLMEIRYAEVLLNYAEAACGAGHMDEAVEQLKLIRQRAGYTGDCGLQANLASDQAACMSAVLYERQIELAYEGKRFDDLRRWMLFDGGQGKVEGAPATWNLTGWGGNTCTYLGFEPLNGSRRDNMEFRLNNNYGLGGKTGKPEDDPLLKAGVERFKGLDLRQEINDEEGNQLTLLQAFYNEHFVRMVRKGDAYDSSKVPLYMNFLPRYYFIGLANGAMNNCVGIKQNIGWADTNNGGANGTFDPLAD